MPKVSSATYKFAMKPYVDGEGKSVLILKVRFNGETVWHSPIKLKKADFNAKQQKTKDNATNKLMNEWLSAVKEYEYGLISKGQSYDSKVLVDWLKNYKSTDSNKNEKKLITNIIDKLITERNLKFSTTKHYQLIAHTLEHYCNVRYIDALDNATLRQLAKSLEKDGLMHSTIRGYLLQIQSLTNYAYDNGLIEENPFRGFDFKKLYKNSKIDNVIPKGDINEMENYLVNKCCYVDQLRGEWHYINYENFKYRYKKLFSMWIFLMGYYLQGLALADLARLKASQFKTITIGEGEDCVEYYNVINVHRQKTKREVTILIEKTDFATFLFTYWIETASERGGLLLPVMKHGLTEKQEDRLINNTTGYINKNLKAIVAEMNSEFGTTVDEDISYYACRHSFASHYIHCEGASPIHLATMMGRSVVNIFDYVTALTETEKLIEERKKVFGDK